MSQKGRPGRPFRNDKDKTEMNSVHLKLTSAIAIGGNIFKPGTIVEVSDSDARDLLNRGKAEVATADDVAQEADTADTADAADAADAAAQPAAEAQPAAPKASRKK
jgi:hypothetical protein